MLLIKHHSYALGWCWRPANISSKLNLSYELADGLYCPIMFHR